MSWFLKLLPMQRTTYPLSYLDLSSLVLINKVIMEQTGQSLRYCRREYRAQVSEHYAGQLSLVALRGDDSPTWEGGEAAGMTGGQVAASPPFNPAISTRVHLAAAGGPVCRHLCCI